MLGRRLSILEEKKRRGRPPGSRNKPVPKLLPSSPSRAKDAYQHEDPDTLVAQQLTLLSAAQQSVRERMVDGTWDMRDLAQMATALSKTIEALKRTQDVAEEVSRRMSPEQLLEAAIAKISAQDEATVEYCIRRLREVRRATKKEQTATDALADLE